MPAASVVDVSASPFAKLRPLPNSAVRLGAGLWADRRKVNREVGLEHGHKQLGANGNWHDLALACGRASGEYRGPCFMDSDVYKWVEGVALELGNGESPQLRERFDAAVELVAASQQPDGYLNSYVQRMGKDRRWKDLRGGHELYCAGHLIQAAVAASRCTGDDRLLEVARRFADLICQDFADGANPGVCGHPEIEMAMVELYRQAGERRYLEQAQRFVDRRGKGVVGQNWPFDSAYYQDDVPVRDAKKVAGHSVRQLYLMSGVTDLYLETGEPALLDAMLRQEKDLLEHQLYLHGGIGSRHYQEAFGNAYELPSGSAYAETCASIAMMQWAWRMLLATGHGRFGDLIERAMYNNVLAGVSLDGTRYLYVNPLASDGQVQRPLWHGCACCPPNVMRTLASLHHMVATADAAGVQIHLYAPGTIDAAAAGLRLDVQTRYPWDGRVSLTVRQAAGGRRTISLRKPAWCQTPWLRLNGKPVLATEQDGYVRVLAEFAAGDTLELSLPMPPRWTVAHPNVESAVGSVALERGPLVYCIEQADQPPDVSVPLAAADPKASAAERWRDDLGGVIGLAFAGSVGQARGWEGSLYRDAGEVPPQRPATLAAIPFYAWANREPGAMRVWIRRGSC